MTEPTTGPEPPPPPARRAGRLTGADGRPRLWTVAEGVRGRRWRERWTTADGAVALLLEVDPGGRWRKLEMAGPSGLLTLHPERDQATVHGNLVSADGVHHVALPWEDVPWLHVVGSLATAAVLAAGLDPLVGVGERGRIPGLVVAVDGTVALAGLVVARPDPDTWAIEAAGAIETTRLDATGLPAAADAASWPLELDPG